MTLEQLHEILRDWQQILHLEHWELELKVGGVPEDALAHFNSNDYYDQATISVAEAFESWSLREAHLTVVHELVHLMQRDLDQATLSLEDRVSVGAWSVFRHRWTHETEGLVERTARALVELAGVA